MKRKFLFFTFCLLVSIEHTFCNELLDLESAAQEFVLETKRIEIPGYPHAFNPGIIRWRGQLLMSFRVIPERKHSYNGEIGLVFLNEEFCPMSEPQLLSLRDEYSPVPCRAEDARLITMDDKLYMVYDDNAEPKLSKGGFRVYVAELRYNGEHFIADPVECLSHFENESRNVREKAWVPFDYEGYLLLAYSIDPHRIFFPHLDGTGICDTIACTENPIVWDWGILRGGTPGFIEGAEYLAFFHSSIDMATTHSDGKKIAHYFIGAYLYSSEPPFTITKISPEPIIGKNFYKGAKYKPYWKPVRCVFPCGYISDDKYIWITYGRDDHESWVAKLDKQALLQSLVPCSL
ncbi:MAG: hypothetical protein WA347_07215 [Rhabdochlamydiaceae bacterium]|jgi:predicted GH43/DUF377 family glycosyl hydrolase